MTLSLAFDPGQSTGWSILEDGRLVAHGTTVHPPHTRAAPLAFENAWEALRGRTPDLVSVELPIISRKGGAGRAASSGNVYARHGFIVGAAWAAWRVKAWDPTAAQWRKVVGLGKGKQDRASVNERVWVWAEAAVKQAKTRPGFAFPLRELHKREGSKLFDEANAIGLNFAAWERYRLKFGRRRFLEVSP